MLVLWQDNKETQLKHLISLIAVLFVSVSVFALPSGFSSIKLGMSVDEVKSALKKEPQFGYRGERDVSLSPSDGQVLIETDTKYAPYSFLERCWFQFSDGKLYTIIINLNAEKIDHYSVFSTLCEKYGNPDEISPKKSLWKDNSVIMSLEKPLALKYVDAKTFSSKQESSNVDKTAFEKSRDEFLKGL